MVAAVHEAVPPKHDPFVDLVPPQGLKLTPRHYAYLKISEGCNNRCTFCIIPSLRGDLVSRPVRDVMIEAENLVKAGVKELLVISQDTSAYGVDIKYAESKWRGRDVKAKFLELAKELGDSDAWVRLHYVYPYPHVDEVMPLMAERQDPPLSRHPLPACEPERAEGDAPPGPSGEDAGAHQVLAQIGAGSHLRSTFIVGFPGETEDDFTSCSTGWTRLELDRVGCFKYEPVEGAKANELDGAVDEDEKQDRWERFMEHQRLISERRMAKKVGRDHRSPDRRSAARRRNGAAIGRTAADAPEIDGNVFVEGKSEAEDRRPGEGHRRSGGGL